MSSIDVSQLYIGEWADVPGLSARLNGLKRQEWALMNALADLLADGEVSPDLDDEARELALSIAQLDRKFTRALALEECSA